MNRKAGYGALLGIGIGGALCLGAEIRARQDARALSDRALHVLHASTTAAPELHHIEAARARMLVDEALCRHESRELRGLRHLMSALSYLQKDDLTRARKRLSAAEARLGQTADTLFVGAALAAAEGDAKSAGELANRALQTDARHLRARVLLVDLALDAGEASRAQEMLRGLLSDDNRSAALHNRRGIALEMRGKPAAARRAFETAVQLDARLPDGHLNLGRVLRLMGSPREALDAFLAAARLDPGSSAAVLGEGLCRLDLGDVVGARSDLERAHSMGGGNARALLSLGDLDVAEGDLDRALTRYRAAIALVPDGAHGYLKLGNGLMRKHDFAGAAKAFRAAIARDTGASAAHNGLGAALALLGQREEAALALATAADLDETDPNPWLNLARLHQQGGDLDQARQALAAARKRDPNVVLAGL